VVFDPHRRPLPEIPMPNDFATRFDSTSPTRRRLNASVLAPTKWEAAARLDLDTLDGWGTYQNLNVAFESPLDLQNLINRHQGDDYEPSDDAVFLLDVTRGSKTFCDRIPLDLGEGNFPLTLEKPELFSNDRPGEQLFFEDREEDLNRNGRLDEGEDLDLDGVLDHPNTLVWNASGFEQLSFYERETNTLILRPVIPLEEQTTYAVVLTNRLLDVDGQPVRSPFASVNHAAQTGQLEAVPECLSRFELGLGDIAFTWAYSTQSLSRDYVAIRDGLYGLGPLERLAQEYPPDIQNLFPLRDSLSPGEVNVRIVSGKQFSAAAAQLLKTQGKDSAKQRALVESYRNIDFHAVFSFDSPQFFRRVDSEGNRLPLSKQTFELDATSGAAFTRPERITVWLTVPKRRTGPAPAVIVGHGYTGGKSDVLFFGGYFARYGIATIGVENVSHGIGLPPADYEIGLGLFEDNGLGRAYRAIVNNDRSADLNGDGVKDPGADFWTSYIGHTRDVLRQSVVDHMQLVRVLRGFDGVRRWRFDVNESGHEGLAGDFDGDGTVDVGGTAGLSIAGSSLGGIMSALLSGLEPQIDVAIPISGGAGLPDIGVRSIQGGVREAVNLRMFGPLLVSARGEGGQLELWQELPDLNRLGRVKLGVLTPEPAAFDTVVLENLKTKAFRCFPVQEGGRFRAAIASDAGDELRLSVYSGALPSAESSGCRVPDGRAAAMVFDRVLVPFSFQGRAHEAFEPLSALGDGFGLRRQSPEYRRFAGLAQPAIDRADPINFVANAERRRVLRYGTGEEVSTRLLIFNTIGDMNVPIATGVAMARAAGFVDLEQKDDRYGKTPNRVLIDTGVIEGTERRGRNLSSTGDQVHLDVDHFGAQTPSGDGLDLPRLSPPLRLTRPSFGAGGVTGVLFPVANPRGQHGFDQPDPSRQFDLGSYLVNLIGAYVHSGGETVHYDGCLERTSCSWIPPTAAE
jgi:hypothetical protein